MRHRVDHRKLGRTSAHREALLRNLTIALFDKEQIKTTVPKAKELRRFAEKLITLSKRETLHARRLCLSRLQDRDVVAKLFDTLSARYAKRPGGYTRIIRLGPRRGDAADLAYIELVDSEVASAPAAGKTKAAVGKAGKGDKAAPAEAAAGAETGEDQPKTKGKAKAKAEPKSKTKPKSGSAKAKGKRAAAADEPAAGQRAGKAEAGRTGKAKATRARTTGRKSGSGGKSD